MNRRALVLLPMLALSFGFPLLPSCGRDKGSATPQAAQELAELRAEQALGFAGDADSELQAEIAALLSRFDQTADAKLASSPHRITLLHLACVYKKPELARCLLQDGADPNAQQLTESPTAVLLAESESTSPALVPSDTPLTWAAIPHREGATPEEMLPLINLLVEKGADVNKPGFLGAPPLVAATFIPSPAGEAVFLRLLELGARGSEFMPPDGSGKVVPLSALVANHGWNNALEKLLDAGATIATPALSALHAAAEKPGQEGTLRCAKLLLSRGAEVDALNEEGATPLYIAAHTLAMPEGGEPTVVASVCDMLALLLSHGADPLRCCDADPEFPGSCAADFIAMSPKAQNILEERGIAVPRRSINFEAEGDLLLAEVCRASLFGTPAEEIAPYVRKLEALLVTPLVEWRQSPLYADAFGHALKLLVRTDVSQAANIAANLPLWREDEAWQSADARTAALMDAILTTPELVLPRESLLEHARHMDALGVSEVAAMLAELLERDEAAEAILESLCSDASAAIRAGALTARLLRAGLPAPRNGAVASWMADNDISEDTAPAGLKRALLLTSLDKFWYGEMSSDEVRALLDAMRAIGAPRAAAFYAELAPNLSKPEELERLTAPGGAVDAVRYELESATALFLWAQKEALLSLCAPNRDAEEHANEPQD